MHPVSRSTGVTITNPLVLYRSLVATKRIDPDPAQHRLAIHLQKLYDRLKDYEPVVEYKHRLNQISHTLSSNPSSLSNGSAHPGVPKGASSAGLLTSLFEQKRERDSLALTRVLTSHQAALELDSPRGLMLHGEVGSGKSMLVDLFAECLPNRKKKRWHFTTFMLETMAKLEQLRRTRHIIIPSSLGFQEEYSLLWLAREMISSSPILFLDEFQLPDRATSKIMTNLMTAFFHLGGVLIATSNRMPEELAKAAGIEFTPPPTRLESLKWRLGGGSTRQRKRTEDPGGFGAFLEVLKARCEVWELENGKDYRRREAASDNFRIPESELDTGFQGLQNLQPGNVGLGYEQSLHTSSTGNAENRDSKVLPRNFFISPKEKDGEPVALGKEFDDAVASAVGQSHIPWSETSITVYGRTVSVPRHYNGVTYWAFDELCEKAFGPADYVTLASTFHTFILTRVPVLSLLQKNEARRLITLLDALYEARCKFLVQAEAGPDDLFFPESKSSTDSSAAGKDARKEVEEVVDQDAVYSETLSEVYQDATAPFRPNISMYESSSSFPSEPDYTHSRLSGLFADDQLEDTPPNRVRRDDSRQASSPTRAEQELLNKQRPDFSRAGILTGEDEKFAYKRARSRLWEMCGARWWARNEKDWWKPIDKEIRTWERPLSEYSLNSSTNDGSRQSSTPNSISAGEEGIGSSRVINEQQDEVLFRHGASPFRNASEPPPKFQWTHVWGMMKWGKKAGAWGQGVEGLRERQDAKRRAKGGQE